MPIQFFFQFCKWHVTHKWQTLVQCWNWPWILFHTKPVLSNNTSFHWDPGPRLSRCLTSVLWSASYCSCSGFHMSKTTWFQDFQENRSNIPLLPLHLDAASPYWCLGLGRKQEYLMYEIYNRGTQCIIYVETIFIYVVFFPLIKELQIKHQSMHLSINRNKIRTINN